MTARPVPQARADRFVRELAELKIPDPAAARAVLWLRVGGLLMAVGLGLAAAAFPLAHGTDSTLGQGDALALGLGGIAAAVVGGALFLRYSLTGFLRFWLARQSYELDRLGERLTAAPDPPAGAVPGPTADGVAGASAAGPAVSAPGSAVSAPGSAVSAPGSAVLDPEPAASAPEPAAPESANAPAPEGDLRHGVVRRTDPAPR